MMISLFLSLRESLGFNIMFVVLLLNGGEWCELWSMGGMCLQRIRRIES